MSAPTALHETGAPWLLVHAGACAEAVTSALDLLEADDVETVEDATGAGFTLWVHADPLRAVRALHWSAEQGWAVTGDSPRRDRQRWSALPLDVDADPLDVCDAVRALV
ncbi:hypothetical protein Acsp06_36980 [Actinomycetospora sp. NBRC 106375]|uniref:hypothetical protein n=1 Tax=Actinomycetospora sp. NBRC 106375 TaxID=3032207 RepID=UPI0024A55C59|nr:hypothetical protein [Actinomycetospora sp. NBRC 106375]GLZ47513.1 hypothetical protein Acsp06_36980 [Actinomycetospora sp. NBRC 106375]